LVRISPRLLLIPALALMAMTFLPQAAGADVREDMLDRGLRNNGPYANSMVLRSQEAQDAERAELLTKAISVAPDSPFLYFKLAAATLPNIGLSAIYVVDGVKAYGRSFWWTQSLKGLLFISLLFSVFLSVSIITLIRLPRELPRLVHDINETKAKIMIPLLILPAALLGPVVLIGALLMLSGFYMAKSDKWIVYLVLILISAAPLIGGIADRFYSASSPEARAIVDVNEGRDNSLALRVLGDASDFASRFSYATALKREGGATEAVDLFNSIIADNSNPKAMINLGNAYFASGQGEKAKEAYKQALDREKSVLVLYNLSQVYRDSFEYAQGDKYYEEAQAMDSQAVSSFQDIHGKSYNRTVIDAMLSPEELEQAAVLMKRRALPLVGDYGRTAVGGLVLFALFAILDISMKTRSYRCAKCDKLACDMCSDPRQQQDFMCSECLRAQGGEDTSAKARLSRLLEANEEKSRMITRLRVFSVFPPGLAQAYSGRVGNAFIFMIFFMHPVVAMALNPYFTTGLGGGTHGWLWLAAVPVIVLDYLISFITVNRRLDRGWL
jgi:tetratricopeptide (TPR) repeat protein